MLYYLFSGILAKPVENRKTLASDVLIAKVPSGKFVAIPYNHQPPHLDNELAQAEHEEKEAVEALSCKEKIEGASQPTDTGIDVQVRHLLSLF